MAKITGIQVKEVIDSYTINQSILETAKATGISTVKVRKILITEGLWQSNTSIKIGELLSQGMTTEEIADRLYMSVKNVQAYMPYERGLYGSGELSKDAIRSDKYRKRMKMAASMQVLKVRRGDMSVKKTLKTEESKVLEACQGGKGKEHVMRLHLELDISSLNAEEMRILKKYGFVKQAISRDILIPGDMTLHALNYAVLRLFGWKNGHLHNFSLPEDVYEKLTENKFLIWAQMAGVYFRFPTENYEDIYWDDDYREGTSVRSWMKKKYTGPYKYKGYGEYYVTNQIKVEDMFARWDEITVREFSFDRENQPAPYRVKLKEATVDQVMKAFADVMCFELIERLPVSDVLCTKDRKEEDFSEVRRYVLSKANNSLLKFVLEEYGGMWFQNLKQKRKLLESSNIPAIPVTKQLIYSYDYGDGWKVRITCEDIYQQDDKGIWKGENGEAEGEIIGFLEEVVSKYRPVCIEKDGIELVDDVGGIYGFCDMLRTIYETDINNEEDTEERRDTIVWAEMMGWTGRKISPKQTL